MTISVLARNNIDSECDDVKTLLKQFESASGIFDGLQTEYQQMKFFKACGYYIEPESYVVGQRLDTHRTASGTVTVIPVKCTAQHIPMHKIF